MKKAFIKTLSTLLVAVMLVSSAPLAGFLGLELPDWLDSGKLFAVEAEAATSGYYTYTVSGNKATIRDVDSSISGNIAIPSTLGGYPVTSIGNYAFDDCDSLTSITIPGSVTSMGYCVFYSCDSLTSITVDKNNINYSSDASGVLFNKNKTQLIQYPIGNTRTNYVIPDSVTSIGNDAFRSCNSLTSITIPDSVTSIGDWAFDGCDSLTSITIGNSVTSIGHNAFYYCTSLTTITVDKNNKNYSSDPSGVLFNKNKTQLIQYPMGNTRTNYVIPDSVTSIGNYAFGYCTSLTSVTIGSGVTSIGEGAFYACDSLTSITIPDSVTSIGNGAFEYCTSLTSITIPDSVTSIGNGAFEYCTSLTSITIPDSITSIGSYTFAYCDNLTSITIPDSVTSIGYSAFYSCASLTSITIPDSVTSIGVCAFGECTSLTSITIPDSVTSIGYDAFYYCTSLTSITIPDSVTSIGGSVFRYCDSLTSITIPDSVTSIGYSAFFNCGSLTDVYFTGSESQWNNIAISSFNEDLTNATIHYEYNPTAHSHSYTSTVTKEATCTQTGVKTYVCNCGNSYTETIEKAEHTFGEWVVTKNPTIIETGVKVQYCTVCNTPSDESTIDKLSSSTYSDTSTGIIINYPSDIVDFNPTVTVVTDGVDAYSVKYEIAFESSDVVEIKIPVPAGFSPNQTVGGFYPSDGNFDETVFSVSNKDGFVVFTVNKPGSFTVSMPISSLHVQIRTPSTTTIKYGDGIILHADLSKALPAGWSIKWTASNGNFDYSVSADGTTCTITPSKSGDTTFTATVYDAEGNEVCKDEQTMTSKAGFFQKLAAFFKKLFGLTKVIPQAFNSIY